MDRLVGVIVTCERRWCSLPTHCCKSRWGRREDADSLRVLSVVAEIVGRTQVTLLSRKTTRNAASILEGKSTHWTVTIDMWADRRSICGLHASSACRQNTSTHSSHPYTLAFSCLGAETMFSVFSVSKWTPAYVTPGCSARALLGLLICTVATPPTAGQTLTIFNFSASPDYSNVTSCK